jgi:hypothetical protein
MRRHWRAFSSRLRKLKLTDFVTLATLAKTLIEIVRSLTSHS